MYGFKHSDTCIINKIIQKYVTKFFLPSILVQELLHLKKYPMAMQLFHNIITCTRILQIQSNKLHLLPSRIVYGFQDLTHTKAPCTLSQFGEPLILYVHGYVSAIHVLIKVSLTHTIHHSINQRRFTFKLCSYTYLINIYIQLVLS